MKISAQTPNRRTWKGGGVPSRHLEFKRGGTEPHRAEFATASNRRGGRGLAILTLAGMAALLPLSAGLAPPGEKAAVPTSEPADNLGFWLREAKPAWKGGGAPSRHLEFNRGGTEPHRAELADHRQAASGPGQEAETATAAPPATESAIPPATRPDDPPGVIELSDGRLFAGRLAVARQDAIPVYVAPQQRWRRIPLPAVLSIQAVVEEEKMELQWRWKEMGSPERIYTGESYPLRRLAWRFHLADGSEIVGEVMGLPIWLDSPGGRLGPFVLHQRQKGPLGGKLSELVYPKRIIISRRAMEALLASPPARPFVPHADRSLRSLTCVPYHAGLPQADHHLAPGDGGSSGIPAGGAAAGQRPSPENRRTVSPSPATIPCPGLASQTCP